MKFAVGQVWNLSYGDSSAVFLLLERYLEDIDVDGCEIPDVEARWHVVRLIDGVRRNISEEWLLDEGSVKL